MLRSGSSPRFTAGTEQWSHTGAFAPLSGCQDGPDGMLPQRRAELSQVGAPFWPPQLSSGTDLQNINKLQTDQEIRRTRVIGDTRKLSFPRQLQREQQLGTRLDTMPGAAPSHPAAHVAQRRATPYVVCSQEHPRSANVEPTLAEKPTRAARETSRPLARVQPAWSQHPQQPL